MVLNFIEEYNDYEWWQVIDEDNNTNADDCLIRIIREDKLIQLVNWSDRYDYHEDCLCHLYEMRQYLNIIGYEIDSVFRGAQLYYKLFNSYKIEE